MPQPHGSGLYAIYPERSLTSASTIVVSTLLALRYHNPGGVETESWVSTTLRVPSGQPVRLPELFADPGKAIAVIAADTRRALLSPGSRMASSCKQMGSLCDNRIAPLARNFETFAMTDKGLVVGITALCGTACGRSQATVPWEDIRAYLSSQGQALVDGVRAPSSWQVG